MPFPLKKAYLVKLSNTTFVLFFFNYCKVEENLPKISKKTLLSKAQSDNIKVHPKKGGCNEHTINFNC